MLFQKGQRHVQWLRTEDLFWSVPSYVATVVHRASGQGLPWACTKKVASGDTACYDLYAASEGLEGKFPKQGILPIGACYRHPQFVQGRGVSEEDLGFSPCSCIWRLDVLFPGQCPWVRQSQARLWPFLPGTAAPLSRQGKKWKKKSNSYLLVSKLVRKWQS